MIICVVGNKKNGKKEGKEGRKEVGREERRR